MDRGGLYDDDNGLDSGRDCHLPHSLERLMGESAAIVTDRDFGATARQVHGPAHMDCSR